MDLSVIICAHNEERFLPEQLDALLAQEWDGEWEILVVDNRSTDSTAARVRSYAARDPRVRLVDAPARADKSYALAVGFEAAHSDLIAVCDADDVVADGWLDAIARGLERHEVVTGPHELDMLNPRWLADSRGRSAENPAGSYYGIFPTIRGANWGTHRQVWDTIGGMREGFRAMEDIAFSLDCWLAGIEIVGLPDAVVHYRYRETPRALWRQGFAYGAFRPRIARLLVEADMPRPPRFAGWKSWALLVLKLPGLVTPEGRAVWMWIAANRWGQVVGSLRHRTLVL